MFYKPERPYVPIAFALLAVFLFASFLPPEISPQTFRARPLSEQLEIIDSLSRKKDLAGIKKLLQASYPEEPQNRHELAHRFGEIAIEKKGIDGFGFCDSFLAYGCFHGAALAAVRLYGYDSDIGEKLWDGCKKASPQPGICLHGLGHALTILKNYDILAAYRECEKILSGTDQFWCQDGASMENIERSMANAGLEPYGDYGNIYFPCNSLPENYEAVCVRNHLGFARREFSWTEEKSISFCLSYANADTRMRCVEMLGSIWMSENWENIKIPATLCQKTEQFFDCIAGTVTTLSMARRYDEADSLCELLPEKENKLFVCKKRIESLKKINGEN